ncbi:sensor histidine kinase [Cryobacterium zhongshanensis]|uniref:histidine kinase n=1 Tax=Cryobacterium zhongshanensis TaxID=2928153 RepID=A0AA41UHZ8_9MICO|nr:histidine kinase [Cryobacterium zhongshanensis]MCI4658974.1 histidine kinase [Cryobacterium zhongshanensis]
MIVTVAILVCITVGFIVAAREFTQSDLLAIVLYAGLAAFAWNPNAAAFAVMSVCAVGVIFLGSGGDLLELALAAALVSATCVPRVLFAYAALLTVLTVHISVTGSALAEGGLYGVVGIAVIALLAGLTFRIVAARESILIADRGRVMTELGLLAREEQEKIADELHDGIAHDLTLVLFHARALPLQPDEPARNVSLTTIEEYAERALANIQSLLTLIRDGETSRHGDETTRYQGRLVDVISSLATLLRNAGIPTIVALPVTSCPLSPAGERMLTEIAIEAVTNIIKHAPTSGSARIDITDRSDVVELIVTNAAPSGAASRTWSGGGRGMVRSRQRLEQLSGRLESGPTPNGWLLKATVPVVLNTTHPSR